MNNNFRNFIHRQDTHMLAMINWDYMVFELSQIEMKITMACSLTLKVWRFKF